MLTNIVKMVIDRWLLKRWALRRKVSLEEMNRGILEIVQNGTMGDSSGLRISMIMPKEER
jgi:hypothetical protein